MSDGWTVGWGILQRNQILLQTVAVFRRDSMLKWLLAETGQNFQNSNDITVEMLFNRQAPQKGASLTRVQISKLETVE